MKGIHHILQVFLILFICSLAFKSARAQNVAINSTGNAPAASAILDIAETGKGILIPRMTLANRPASPATGLLIYQTNSTPGFYYYNGSGWVALLGGTGTGGIYGGSGSLTADPTTVTMGTNNLAFTSTVINGFSVDGTTFSVDAASNLVGIGTATPAQPLTVIGDILMGGASTGYDGNAEGIKIIGQSDNWYLGMQNEATVGASDFFIGLNDDTEDGIFHIQNNGNIGIGTSSPSTKLDVVGVLELSNTNPSDPGSDIVRLGDGGTNLEIQTNYGYTRIGPANTGWSHFSTDRVRYYFDKGITVDEGLIGSYNENLSLQTSGTTRITALTSNGYVGIGETSPAYNLEVNGTFGYGDGTSGTYRSRTETRADAGLMASQSGFYQTSAPAPAANWPAGASSWWHLLDVRHSNNTNNYAMQIAGSFFDQDFWVRKTDNSSSTAWAQLITTANIGSYGDNLGNHTATMNLEMANFEIDDATYVDITAGTGYGVRFWSSNSYAINMGNAAEYHFGPVTDYSIKMNMSATAGRGWTWGIDGSVPVGGLSNTGDYQIAGNYYGKSVNSAYSNIYRMGGIFFTWDSDSYGTNTHHSIRSTYGDTYGDNLTMNSFNHIRFNMDANNNNGTSYFELGDNTTGTGNIIFRVQSGGDVALNGKHAFRSNDGWLRLNQDNAFTSGTYTPYLIRADGGYQVDGNQVIDADAGWHRSYGSTGWYNSTYGGGIYMTDATWIRTYGNKSFYHNTGTMRTDGTFQVGPSGNRMIVQTNGNVGINGTPNGNNNFLTSLQNSTTGTAMWANTSANSSWVTLESSATSTTQGTGISGTGYTGVSGSSTSGAGWAGYFDYDTYIDWMYYWGATLLSDRRLKHNIRDIDDGLKYITALNPVVYEKIRGIVQKPPVKSNAKGFEMEEENIPEFGLIAQEVEKILPELVSSKDMYISGQGKLSVKGINYDGMIPIMIKATQQQQEIIEEQNRTIEELKDRITRLENGGDRD